MLRELYAKKRKAFSAWKAIMDLAKAEDRELTTEEVAQANAAEADIDAINDQIAAAEEAERRNAKVAEIEEQLRNSAKAPPAPLQQEQSTAPDTRSIIDKLREAHAAGKTRQQALSEIAADQSDKAKVGNKAIRQYLATGMVDRAALQQDSDAAGGFLVAPEQFVARLIQDVDRMVWFRQYATILPLSGAESIGVPTLETDISDTNWTTELSTGTPDTSMAFGKRRLTPHPLAKSILVSKDLLRAAAISVDALVRERLAYKFATVQEAAFMTGSGAGQPLGVFTASDSGISTGRDVSTDNTNTTFTADGLINCKYALEAQYQTSPNLRWIFHRDALKMARKLKDGDGQYLWQPGLVMDRPDMLLGVPVLQSEYAPNTFTSGLYVGLIGDLTYYWIAESMSLDIQRLVELGALTNQDYFIGRTILDGMPVHENAFARVTLT